MNKKAIIIVVMVILITLVGGISYKNKVEYIGTPLEPMYKLIKIQYFNQGTYQEYKSLFTDQRNVLEENQFETNRKCRTAQDAFKYDSDTIKGIMKHMKLEKEKDNVYKVYYLKNVNNEKEKKSANYWMVIKKESKWLLKNGI